MENTEEKYQGELRTSNVKIKDQNNSQIGSVSSAISSDMKNVNSIKSQLNAKKTPKSILMLRRVIIIMLAVLGSLSIIDYVVNKLRINDINFNFQKMETVANRFTE